MATEDVVQSSSLNVPQQRGFPDSIMYYIKMNAPPRLLLKLMQASKYFCFKEFPFMVVENLQCYNDTWEFLDRNVKENVYNKYQKLDLNTLVKPLWISNSFDCLFLKDANFFSFLLSKTAVCDIQSLILEDQIITWDQFKFLTSSGIIGYFEFEDSDVKYDNGNIVPMDEMIKLLPEIRHLYW
uniref:Uncharacterized protein n=1 Tax=Panagrolaimus sp. ES5 TaxID=591445 RepID=A0AC34F473_9BILA